jgi:hypothetical protein
MMRALTFGLLACAAVCGCRDREPGVPNNTPTVVDPDAGLLESPGPEKPNDLPPEKGGPLTPTPEVPKGGARPTTP